MAQESTCRDELVAMKGTIRGKKIEAKFPEGEVEKKRVGHAGEHPSNS